MAEDLTKEFGKNYSKRNLHYYIKFYQCFPDEQIVNACVHNLNWTHVRSLLRVADENARYAASRSICRRIEKGYVDANKGENDS